MDYGIILQTTPAPPLEKEGTMRFYLAICGQFIFSFLYYTHHTLWPMPKIQVHGRRNCSITDTVPRSSCLFPFYGLAFAFGHFFGKRIFPLFLDVTDASGAVGIEQKGEHLAYPIGKHLAVPYVMRAFGASFELVFLAA